MKKNKFLILSFFIIVLIFFNTSNLSAKSTNFKNNILFNKINLNKMKLSNNGHYPLWNYEFGSGNSQIVAMSANGLYIAIGSNDGIYLFDNNGTLLWNYPTGNWVRSIAMSAGGQYITAGCNNGYVYSFNKENSEPIWNYSTNGAVRAIAISEDGQYIAVGSYDDKVYLFNFSDSTPTWINNTKGEIISIDISADGEYIAVSTNDPYDDKRILLFDKDDSNPLWSYTAPSFNYFVSISGDGQYTAAGNTYGSYFIYNRSHGYMWNYTNILESTFFPVISNNSKYLVIVGRDTWLFNPTNSTPIWISEYGADTVAISSDGNFFITGGDRVRLFNSTNSTPLWDFNTNNIRSVSISANGEYMAAGGYYTGEFYFFHITQENPPIKFPDFIAAIPLHLELLKFDPLNEQLLIIMLIAACVGPITVCLIILKRGESTK